MIKLFAVDLDDTFLDKNDNMSKENINAVRDLVDAGVKVVLNSGRTEVLMREHIHDLGLEDFKHVAINGALILDVKGENKLISYFDKSSYENFIKELRAENRGFFCYHENGIMYENADEKLMRHIERFHTLKKACEGDTLSLDKCCRVAVVRENEEDVPHLRALAPKGVYTTARPYGECVSYMPDGLNKANGLKVIMDEYKITADEVASIGDQEVDTYMFDISKYGIAVKNSDDKTKEAADIVLPRTNNENAFAYAAYKYILKDEDKLKHG
ncbi:HAD-IIB family hydrolase [Anaerofustis stercorihominis]|uniref:HAD family phosphatase n=1 Tax=Anaerofustis stercorihominis TaxID=214853 RepID=A0A3E3DVJ3_9FIRM|nr:HAD-IIB family hydrolase [Anaerofustis stercorihominis]RGD72999.1 HAD family phosphatase [Anaerofustis stercorihominis]